MATRNFWTIHNGKIAKGIIEFKWEPGMSTACRTRSCKNLHHVILLQTGLRALDISTASYVRQGYLLSAFNLMYKGKTVECLYQGSKVYEDGYVAHDLYNADSLAAKKSMKDPHGSLVGFDFYGTKYPLQPQTVFYDYLYLQAIMDNYGEDLVLPYNCFTDIQAIINIDACQARSVCEYKLLQEQNNFKVLKDFEAFKAWHEEYVEIQYTECEQLVIRYLNDDTVACYPQADAMLTRQLMFTGRTMERVDEITVHLAPRKSVRIDNSWCIVYTDLLLDDLCAIEFLSRHYDNIYCVIVNEEDIGKSEYGSKAVNGINDIYTFLRKWFSFVILMRTSASIPMDDLSGSDCYLLANATKLIADIEAGVQFRNIAAMIGSEDTEWNASQDLVAYHKLKKLGIRQYDKEFCESCTGYPAQDLAFFREYIDTMTTLGENTCCYDLQAVAEAIKQFRVDC